MCFLIHNFFLKAFLSTMTYHIVQFLFNTSTLAIYLDILFLKFFELAQCNNNIAKDILLQYLITSIYVNILNNII